MLVRDLIAALQALPPDAPACVRAPTGGCAYEIGRAEPADGTYLPVDALVARGAHVVLVGAEMDAGG